VTSSAGGPAGAASIEQVQSLALRLAVASALLAFVLGLYARTLDLLRTDVPLLASNGRLFWVISLVAIVAFGFVITQLPAERIRSHSSNPRALTLAANGGILPALAVTAAVQFVAWDNRIVVLVAAPLLAGAGVFTASVVRHYLLDGDPTTLAGARLVHLVLTGAVALLTLSLLRGWMGGPGYTLIAVFIVSTALLVQAFDGIRAFAIRRMAYALAGGAVVGQVALSMSYLPPSPWVGGAFLTVVFAIVMVTIDAVLARRVTTDLIARYLGAGVALCGLLVVLAR
jgi:hypothetical protein